MAAPKAKPKIDSTIPTKAGKRKRYCAQWPHCTHAARCKKGERKYGDLKPPVQCNCKVVVRPGRKAA